MNQYRLQYRAPRMRGWTYLSVRAKAPLPLDEVRAYRQQLAEAYTHVRGVAVMPDMIRMRLVVNEVESQATEYAL